MPNLIIKYVKNKQFKVIARNHEFICDQPISNGGDNEGPSPAELFVSSLGTCISFYAVDFCKRHGINDEDLELDLSWEYGDRPRRVVSIDISVKIPQKLSDMEIQRLKRVLHGCLIHNSIINAPEVIIDVKN